MRKDMEACTGPSKMEISLLSLSLLRLNSVGLVQGSLGKLFKEVLK